MSIVDYLSQTSWLSPHVHYFFYMLGTLSFEAAFMCWWRYFAIRDSVIEPEPPPNGIRVSSLLFGFALLFMLNGVTNSTEPFNHILWRPWYVVDWVVYFSTMGQILAALWVARMMTVEDCGEKLWILMGLSSAVMAALLIVRYP